jgi:hypothetical protein
LSGLRLGSAFLIVRPPIPRLAGAAGHALGFLSSRRTYVESDKELCCNGPSNHIHYGDDFNHADRSFTSQPLDQAVRLNTRSGDSKRQLPERRPWLVRRNADSATRWNDVRILIHVRSPGDSPTFFHCQANSATWRSRLVLAKRPHSHPLHFFIPCVL